MRILIVLVFLTQILIHLAQWASLHFSAPQEWIPYYVRSTKPAVKASETKKTQTIKVLKPQGRTSDSVAQLESMRKEQLSQLNMAENLNPVQLNGAITDSKSGSNSNYKPPSLPASTQVFLNDTHSFFLKEDPKVVMVWFQSGLNVPVPVRYLWLANFVLGLLALFSLIPKFLSNRSGPYEDFVKSVKAASLKKGLNLWQDENIRSRFQEENRKVQLKWFKVLVKGKKLESARDWGTVLYQNKPEDRNHALNLTQVILSTSKNGIDLKYSRLLNWYLKEKQDTKAAQLIWEKSLKDYEHSMIAPEVYELCKSIQTLLNHPELSSFIESHPVYSN